MFCFYGRDWRVDMISGHYCYRNIHSRSEIDKTILTSLNSDKIDMFHRKNRQTQTKCRKAFISINHENMTN